jgi:hypothetical protein
LISLGDMAGAAISGKNFIVVITIHSSRRKVIIYLHMAILIPSINEFISDRFAFVFFCFGSTENCLLLSFLRQRRPPRSLAKSEIANIKGKEMCLSERRTSFLV